MATNTNTRRQAETTSPKRPTYNVFAVTERGEDRKDWVEIGAAWAHSDGKGFTITLKALALPGAQIVLREPKPSESKE